MKVKPIQFDIPEKSSEPCSVCKIYCADVFLPTLQMELCIFCLHRLRKSLKLAIKQLQAIRTNDDRRPLP